MTDLDTIRECLRLSGSIDRTIGNEACDRLEARLRTLEDAARLALDHTECKGYCSDAGCPFCGGTLREARAALAAAETPGEEPDVMDMANPTWRGGHPA